ncbi:SIR2 family NAD-dependent protein deacylase [Dysgonomonas sp. HGC4]|uniref:SIR2 family NAD-dependent protein deacylase n=1 Tax=Dysgonomonas sp. HGC4 TaxID=1658009 RepID=UPI00068377E1|nr:NAD-dependent deacylase [Dysgonomonas sp. HGC4]MBD8348615.1 NAD-dependent deacylase [Dysgonomonas sp. HGC4]
MKNIVVLTGAGMSAESGIATFRDSGGLWAQHRVEDVATPEGFQRNPQLVLDFYNKRRRESLLAKPNRGHIGLAEMEQEYNVQIITQNVDNLHEKAGSSSVIHLHGELMKARSSINPYKVYPLDPDNPDISVDDKCDDGSPLRPYIVWFGEAVPLMTEAEEIVRRADALVVIGTSLNVYPAAGLINYVYAETPIYVIDPNDVSVSRGRVHFIRKGASEGVAELRDLLKEQFGHNKNK